MGVEIERKFLVKAAHLAELVRDLNPDRIRQGYLCSDPERTVRVRTKGDKGFLTIKGKTAGISRQEFEYPIPPEEARALLSLCSGPLIEKNRYRLNIKGQLWEIDEFFGDNTGLLLAEAELDNEEQVLEIPDWIIKEVTDDPRYYNAKLAVHPYGQW